MNIHHELYKQDLNSVISAPLPWEKIKNKCIMITGANGLIGSFLVDVLMERDKQFNENIKVLVLCRNKQKASDRFKLYLDSLLFKIIEQDVCDPFMTTEHIDYIIHAASNANPIAYSTDPVGTMKANLLGTINILEYSKLYKVQRTIFISSGEVYGENRDNVDSFREDYCGYINCNESRSCYPESKRAAEALCASYRIQHNIDTVIIRPCHIYGPTIAQSDSRVIAQFIRNAVKKENIILKSDGLQLRSMCYISDAVSAIFYGLLLGEKGEVYNIANKNSNNTIREISETLSILFNLKVNFQIPDDVERKGYTKIEKAVLNSDKIESLGWKPSVTLKEGLRRTVNILRD